MENTVDMMEQGLVQDDAVLEPVQETNEEQHPGLEEFTEEAAQPEQQAPTEEVHLPKREPGWVRQRVDKAVQRTVQETEARMRAEFEGVLAPIRESVLDREADNLVSSGEFRSKETALEYVRMKQGLPGTVQQPVQQPQVDPRIQVRGEMLARQADKIMANYGVDVIAEYNNNAETQQKILSGEWDFYDVVESVQQRTSGRRSAPPLVRTPGGSGLSGKFSVADMSDAQFEKLQQNLRAGKSYDAR